MDSQWALVIATGALIVITAWYARATWLMARNMKEQTDALLAPFVVVRAERREGSVRLVVENTGRSAARDLKLSADWVVQTNDHGMLHHLQEDRLFKGKPVYLTPGERREIEIGTEDWIREQWNYYYPVITVTVSYGWRGGEPMEEEVPIEVHSLWSEGEWFTGQQAYRARHPQPAKPRQAGGQRTSDDTEASPEPPTTPGPAARR
jgi:hypothetical protein